jgi:hypothetical protein
MPSQHDAGAGSGGQAATGGRAQALAAQKSPKAKPMQTPADYASTARHSEHSGTTLGKLARSEQVFASFAAGHDRRHLTVA